MVKEAKILKDTLRDTKNTSMARVLAMVFLLLATLACGVPATVGSIQPLERSTGTAPTLSPTAQITPSPLPTQANTYTVVGNWNLRPNSDGSGASFGIVYDGHTIEVVHDKPGWTWALVQTVGDPVLTGWIKKESYND